MAIAAIFGLLGCAGSTPAAGPAAARDTVIVDPEYFVEREPAKAPEPPPRPRYAVEVHVESHQTWNLRVRPLAIAVDRAGGVIVAGQFPETIDFGGGPLTAVGGLDLFVASWDATGQLRFAKPFGGAGTDMTRAIAIASDDTIWVPISCADPVPAAAPAPAAADAATTAVPAVVAPAPPARPCPIVVGLGPDGSERRSIRAHAGKVRSTHLAIAADGDLVLAGSYDEGAQIRRGSSLGPGKSWIARFDGRGRPRWVRTLGRFVSALGLGANGRIVFGTSGEGTFGEGWPEPAGAGRGLVGALEANGTPLWIRAVGPESARIASVSADARGDVCVGGLSDRPPQPAPAEPPRPGETPIPEFDALVASLTSGGDVRWSRTFGEGGFNIVYGVAAAEDGRCVVTGENGGRMDLGHGLIRSPLVSEDTGEQYPIPGLFVASFASSGEPRWARSEHGGVGWGIVPIGEDHVVVVGRSSGADLPEQWAGPALPTGLFIRRLAPGAEPPQEGASVTTSATSAEIERAVKPPTVPAEP